jgi:hypothetical protein
MMAVMEAQPGNLDPLWSEGEHPAPAGRGWRWLERRHKTASGLGGLRSDRTLRIAQYVATAPNRLDVVLAVVGVE